VTIHPPIDDYVVTLGIDYADGKQPTRVIYEMWRGDPQECIDLMHRMSTPSNDKRSIEHWWMQLGPAQAWEEFARSP
jgi:hypothetical protein